MRGTYGTPVAGTRTHCTYHSTYSAWGPGGKPPEPAVRTQRERLARAACMYPTEAPQGVRVSLAPHEGSTTRRQLRAAVSQRPSQLRPVVPRYMRHACYLAPEAGTPRGKEKLPCACVCLVMCAETRRLCGPRRVWLSVCVSTSSPRLHEVAASVSAPDRRSHGTWSARVASAASAPSSHSSELRARESTTRLFVSRASLVMSLQRTQVPQQPARPREVVSSGPCRSPRGARPRAGAARARAGRYDR